MSVVAVADAAGAREHAEFRVRDVLLLFLTLGYPRIPYTDIPACAIVFVTHAGAVSRLLSNREARNCTFLVALLYVGGILLWALHPGTVLQDMTFFTSVCIKIALNIVVGFALATTIRNDTAALMVWVVIQAVLVVASVLSPQVFQMMALFGGRSGYEVYSSLFDQRGLGFGLTHVYGAIIFLGATFYYAVAQTRSRTQHLIVLVSQGLGLLLSRTGIPVLLIYLAVCAQGSLFLFVAAFLALSTIATTGVFGTVFELGVNLIREGRLQTVSTDASFGMFSLPNDLPTALFGTGKFFDGGIFYMGSDVGYTRIVYFGGFFFLALFIVANAYPALRVIHRSPKWRRLAFVYLATFLVANVKGLADITIFPYLLLFAASQRGEPQVKKSLVEAPLVPPTATPLPT